MIYHATYHDKDGELVDLEQSTHADREQTAISRLIHHTYFIDVISDNNGNIILDKRK